MLALLTLVCVLEVSADEAKNVVDRIRSPETNVRTIAVDASLGDCDVVVLPSGWAQHAWKPIAARFDALSAWVRDGHGLLVFQPNPYGDAFETERVGIDLLDAPFTVENRYVGSETAIAVEKHPLTQGIATLPFPADRIVSYDDAWTPLAKGSRSGDASLLVAKFGRGRAVIDTENPSMADAELLARLITWLGSTSSE